MLRPPIMLTVSVNSVTGHCTPKATGHLTQAQPAPMTIGLRTEQRPYLARCEALWSSCTAQLTRRPGRAIRPRSGGECHWVVGDEPCVVIDFAGMEHYAESH